MTNLFIKFKLKFESLPVRTGGVYAPGLHGPQFHKWLPDGEQDALVMETEDPSVIFKIWFERRGFVENGLIKFDYDRNDFDLQIMTKQGKLEGGPLIGLLEIHSLSRNELNCLQARQIEDNCYLKLEKRVIRIVYPLIKRFINILRSDYGQYWISEIEDWDSRIESASSYMRRYGFPKFSLDGGETWKIFPSTFVQVSVGALRKRQDFSEYLTKEDWLELSMHVNLRVSPSPAASLLANAVESFDRGFIRHSLIDAITALEMAIGESFRERINLEEKIPLSVDDFPFSIQSAIAISIDINSESLESDIHKIRSTFFNLKLTRQFKVMSGLLKIPNSDVDNTLNLIDIRNRIVHEGESPPKEISNEFSSLLRSFSVILSGRKLRFPMALPGNRILNPEDWDQLFKDHKR